MSKAGDVIRHELKEAIFPTVFFWFVFHFLIITKVLILASYNLQWVAVASATIAALIVAKAILIVDVTPAGRMFRGSRLVYHVLWRTILYSVLVGVFRYAEELIPLWSKYGTFTEANSKLVDEFSWLHFMALQLWLLVSIAAYSTIVTVDEHYGAGSLKKALFGRRSAGS